MKPTTPEFLPQLREVLTVWNEPLDEEADAELIAKLAAIEEELRAARARASPAGGGGVRFHKVALSKTIPFPDRVELDLDALPAGLIWAVSGRIGSGKSSLVEAMLLGLYRRSATRGTLDELFLDDITGDATVDVTLGAGRFVIHQSPRGPYVNGHDKKPIFKGTAKPYQEWLRGAAPGRDVLQATQFAAQGSGGLLLADPAVAKDLVLSLAGRDIYAKISERAGKHAREMELRRAALDGRIAEIERAVGERATAEAERPELADAAREAELAADRAAAALSSAQLTAEHDPGKIMAEAITRREVEKASAEARLAAAVARLTVLERERHRILCAYADAGGGISDPDEDGRCVPLAAIPQVELEIENLEREQAQRAARNEAIDAELEALRVEALAKGESRILALRAGVGAVAKSQRKDAQRAADKVLEEDDASAERGASIPAIIEELLTEQARLRDASNAAVLSLSSARDALHGLLILAKLDADEKNLRAEVDDEGDLARTAEEAIQEIHAEVARLRAEADVRDLAPLVQAARDAQSVARAAVAALAGCDAKIRAAVEAGERLDGLRAEREDAAQGREEYELLVAVFGRQGIQALEVDRIGPRLSELANELLKACCGGRWSIAVKTLEEERETFAVMVKDHREGKARTKTARALSPGERALVGEALTAAFTAIACERGAAVAPTIVRDETGVMLDRHDAATWVRLLRAGAELVKASRVIIVSHDKHVITECDGCLVLRDGALKQLDLAECKRAQGVDGNA